MLNGRDDPLAGHKGESLQGGTALLVLTRKRDESIMIGDHIRIVVVDVRGDQVKLGIEAPRMIPVHREEVYLEIQEENRRAAERAQIGVDELARLLKGGLPESAGSKEQEQGAEARS